MAADHEVSVWLRQRGLDPDALEAEIRRLYGCNLENVISDEPVTDTSRPELYSRLESDIEAAAATSGPGPGTPAESAVQRSAIAPQQTALLRVLDAAANRAREGLRVVEDYVRFVLDDRHLTDSASSCATT